MKDKPNPIHSQQINTKCADCEQMPRERQRVGMLADTLLLTGASWYAVRTQLRARSLRPWTRQYSDAKLFRTHDDEFYIAIQTTGIYN